MKSNKSISRIIFWPNSIFCNFKKKNVWFIWFHKFFCLDFLKFSGPLCHTFGQDLTGDFFQRRWGFLDWFFFFLGSSQCCQHRPGWQNQKYNPKYVQGFHFLMLFQLILKERTPVSYNFFVKLIYISVFLKNFVKFYKKKLFVVKTR